MGEESISRRAVLAAGIAVGPAMMLARRAFAEDLRGDELPLVTTGLEHIGMVVPDVEAATRFYSAVFNPDLQKEKDAPLRYYVMLGVGVYRHRESSWRDGSEDRSLLHVGARL